MEELWERPGGATGGQGGRDIVVMAVGRPLAPRRGSKLWDRAATGRGRPVQSLCHG